MSSSETLIATICCRSTNNTRHFYFPGRRHNKIGRSTVWTSHLSRRRRSNTTSWHYIGHSNRVILRPSSNHKTCLKSIVTGVIFVQVYNILQGIAVMMQPTGIASVCLLLLAGRAVQGHAIGDNRADYDDTGFAADRKRDASQQSRALDMESIFAGFAKSMISRTGSTSSQMLSLNMSNVVLMLVLKGLIWGASYMQGYGGKSRKDEPEAGTGLMQNMVTETDLLLFLGYLVADESGRYDCLNRVACEQPARAESYLKSAEMVWKTAKLLDGVMPIDAKYEKMLIKLQEAIEDGRADGDCQAKYKCSESTSKEDNLDLI